ncbi:MAG: outer membrane protein transport protein [Ignavibacteriaceae bacterium]
MKLKKYFQAIFLTIIMYSITFAGGNDLNSNFNSRSFSLNGLYFAGSPGLSSVQSNPAGLIYLTGSAIEASLIDYVIQNEFDSPDRGLYKSYKQDIFSIGGGLYWNFSNGFTAAISYHPVINSSIDWPFVTQRTRGFDSTTATLAFSMLNRLEINSVSPSVAFRIGGLAVGVTANIYHAVEQISFPRLNPLWNDSIGLAAYQFSYNLDGWGYGGTIGLMYDFSETFRIGVTAKSGTVIDVEGDAKSNMFADLDSTASTVNASSEVEIPWRFGIGGLYKLNESTVINVDFAFNLWGSTQEELSYTFDNSIWQNRTSQTDSLSGVAANSITLGYDNSFEFGAGIEHSSAAGLIYRAGYRFSQTYNTSSTYNFLFPSVDQHVVSIGIGYRNESLVIDAGLAYSFGVSAEVTSSVNSILAGEYSAGGYIPSLTLKYEF